ncbi:E3 ubiquitin-protein ligase PRT1-like isoform X2 [Raphanus sativus]|nr:E3 ubiquitin-protein ligase PRT1-like isoform X2 [Raphanus sativus]
MSDLSESHCPICRDPYVHFPAVCQKLHFLLKNIYPLAHNKRENQVLKWEQELDSFSPQMDEPNTKDDSLDITDEQKVEEDSNPTRLLSSNEKEPLEDAKTVNVHGSDLPKSIISKDDFLCSACKDLLVRPMVLNCGHVYCEGCVVDMMDQESAKIKCKECHVCDPRRFPKVCLALQQFLEENFPEEYTSRESGIQKTLGNFQSYRKEGTSSSDENNNNDLPWWASPASNVHVGTGCDSCGVFPIIGDRYSCKDCKEEVGYDLCKDCYMTPSKVSGRFNQQHTSDHRLELTEVNESESEEDSDENEEGPV